MIGHQTLRFARTKANSMNRHAGGEEISEDKNLIDTDQYHDLCSCDNVSALTSKLPVTTLHSSVSLPASSHPQGSHVPNKS